MGPGRERVVEVIVWRPEGDAVLRPPALAQTTIRLDHEHALEAFLADVRARLGSPVVLLRLDEERAHVEAIRPPRTVVGWQTPDIEIGGNNRWNRLGWYVEARGVIDAELSRLGIRRTGPAVQRKHWSISAILSVETDAGTLWYKQVPGFMAHEGRLTAWLGELRPDTVPQVVAVGADWSLTRAFPAPGDGSKGANPFALLGELQQLAAPRADELLALGCPDRRSFQLLRDLEALGDRPDLLNERQRVQLMQDFPSVQERLKRLDDGDVPDTVVHGDLHDGNWSVSDAGGVVMFDWTDGCVAHAFMDLGVLPLNDEAVRTARLEAYLAAWDGRISDLEATLHTALPVAAGFQAVSYQRISDNIGSNAGAEWTPVVGSFVDRMGQLLEQHPCR